MRATLVTLAAMGAAATLATVAPSLRAQEVDSGVDVGIAVGAHAPAAAVRTLSGQRVDLASYIGKSPVLLEFWAVWCGRCKALEPSLLALEKRYGARMTFVTIAVSVNQSPRRVQAYTRTRGYARPVLYDADGNAVAAYNAPATSYIVVIDGAGTVVYSGLGGEQDVRAAVEKGLGGRE